MSRHKDLGNKLGPRLARVLSDAQLHTLKQTADIRRRHAVMAAVDFFRTITHETRRTTRPFMQQIAEHPELRGWAKDTLHFAAHGEGEWQALLSYGVGATGLGSSLTGVMVNDLAPITQSLISRQPNQLITPTGAADSVARGIMGVEEGAHEARRNGINENRFLTLVEAAKRWPDGGELLELLRRGLIDTLEFRAYLRKNGYQEGLHSGLHALARVFISPADAADMVVRGHLSENDAAHIASLSGTTRDDFQLYVESTGAPPGIQEMLFAYRRGIIDKPTLEKGIRQGRLRNEWIPMIESLRFSPMSVADSVQSVVQGHISDGEGHKIAEENGLTPEHWRILVETAGEPASRTEMIELWRRGLATKAEVEQAIRESRMKNKYIAKVTDLRRRLPPERTVVSMLSHGAMSHSETVHILTELGYDHTVIEAFLRQGIATRTVHERHLAKADILALYIERAISTAEAKSSLRSLGYTEHDITLMLHLSDLRRLRRFRDAALGYIRTLYVSHRITESEMHAALDKETIPHEEREQLIYLWGLERGANRRTLSEAQVVSAHRRSLIDTADAAERLFRMGYNQEDVKILLTVTAIRRRPASA